MFGKRIEEMNEMELKNMEMERTLEAMHQKIRKIETIVDSILVKAGMSYSLLVVRKVDNDKLDDLEKIID